MLLRNMQKLNSGNKKKNLNSYKNITFSLKKKKIIPIREIHIQFHLIYFEKNICNIN